MIVAVVEVGHVRVGVDQFPVLVTMGVAAGEAVLVGVLVVAVVVGVLVLVDRDAMAVLVLVASYSFVAPSMTA